MSPPLRLIPAWLFNHSNAPPQSPLIAPHRCRSSGSLSRELTWPAHQLTPHRRLLLLPQLYSPRRILTHIAPAPMRCAEIPLSRGAPHRRTCLTASPTPPRAWQLRPHHRVPGSLEQANSTTHRSVVAMDDDSTSSPMALHCPAVPLYRSIVTATENHREQSPSELSCPRSIALREHWRIHSLAVSSWCSIAIGQYHPLTVIVGWQLSSCIH